ncbi:hypothetical protein INS49_005605 [Diaporthe citri]|uniref:uncharacterized protein n=1 Tax=Diaporthe citri TaxID=83186 RepID=UPI001C7F98AA|nr:uncharacterized protein INS49_005605 [Diaporthe citri]KAG6353424.1 hypothetical protein INS49_005605 [Diaporthe citri]
MWPIWILLLFAGPVFRLISSIFSFAQHYRAAKKKGIPISDEMRQEKLAEPSRAGGESGKMDAGLELLFSHTQVSVEPELQGWIQEEVDHVYGTSALHSSTLECEQYFYRLKHCLAFMEVAPLPVAKELFFPWSLGARNCPGKKFAQVEFVAVMSYVLRLYRVEAIPLKGESPEDTRKRIWDWTQESKA